MRFLGDGGKTLRQRSDKNGHLARRPYCDLGRSLYNPSVERYRRGGDNASGGYKAARGRGSGVSRKLPLFRRKAFKRMRGGNPRLLLRAGARGRKQFKAVSFKSAAALAADCVLSVNRKPHFRVCDCAGRRGNDSLRNDRRRVLPAVHNLAYRAYTQLRFQRDYNGHLYPRRNNLRKLRRGALRERGAGARSAF